MEVLGSDGSSVTVLSEVVSRWERDFKGVFSNDISDFDEKFYKEICLRKYVIENQILKGEYWVNEDLNKDLSYNEIQLAITRESNWNSKYTK